MPAPVVAVTAEGLGAEKMRRLIKVLQRQAEFEYRIEAVPQPIVLPDDPPPAQRADADDPLPDDPDDPGDPANGAGDSQNGADDSPDADSDSQEAAAASPPATVGVDLSASKDVTTVMVKDESGAALVISDGDLEDAYLLSKMGYPLGWVSNYLKLETDPAALSAALECWAEAVAKTWPIEEPITNPLRGYRLRVLGHSLAEVTAQLGYKTIQSAGSTIRTVAISWGLPWPIPDDVQAWV